MDCYPPGTNRFGATNTPLLPAMPRCCPWVLVLSMAVRWTAAEPPLPAPLVGAISPEVWRAERRIVDLHLHVEPLPERLDRAVTILHPASIGLKGMLGVPCDLCRA